jgi:hypothetical protein
LQTFNSDNKKIEFVVSDSGIGIPASLKPAMPNLKSDTDLLLSAVQEGVTNGKGQGNGLFGSLQMCRISGGYFSIESGRAILLSNDRNGIHVKPIKTPFDGTTVYASIMTNKKGLLADALKFKEELHTPIDFLEIKYEMISNDEGMIVIKIDPKTISVGSRISGEAQRVKIQNILELTDVKTIGIDFRDAPLISSSFADGLVAKLYTRMGKEEFDRRIFILNAQENVKSIIAKSIYQRIASTKKETD